MVWFRTVRVGRTSRTIECLGTIQATRCTGVRGKQVHCQTSLTMVTIDEQGGSVPHGLTINPTITDRFCLRVVSVKNWVKLINSRIAGAEAGSPPSRAGPSEGVPRHALSLGQRRRQA
jgi:hypothetical protein